jgi:hypothetical protein
MLPLLRSRPSQMLVALLCALVLSRVPAPVFCEDAASMIVNVDETGVPVVALAPGIDMCVGGYAVETFVQHPGSSEISNHSLVGSSILRL